MPWTAKDANRFTKKADTDSKKNKWMRIANNVYRRCLKEGGSEEECSESAIRIANSKM